jgi:long-subunit acyl-CoA synthetase (AMP-forming)
MTSEFQLNDPKKILTDILTRADVPIAYFPSQKAYTVGDIARDAAVFNALTVGIDRIFIAAPNSYEWLVVYFACILSDKMLITADFLLNAEELNRRIAVSEPALVITGEDRGLTVPTLKTADLLKPDAVNAAKITGAAKTDGYAFIQFTSGTTGVSKGVVIEARQIAANLVGMQALCRFLPDDRFLLSSAMSHPMGHIFMLLTLAYGGGLIILESSVFLPQATLQAGATLMVAPPVMLNSFRALPEMVERLKKFRYLLCAGAPLDKTAYEFYKAEGVRIVNGYGMTECVSGIAMGGTDSTGKATPLFNCEIKLADDGEVLVRGACVCERYLSGAPICPDGWYHTHDLGAFDADGRLTVTGRKDHLVVLQNGYKIALEPLEEKINRTPQVLDCIVRVTREGARDVIECDVVVKKEFEGTAADLKNIINQSLDFYERIDKINIVEKLELKGGKKKRG